MSLVPPVLRSRGWRLYTAKGHLVDLWQYGGRALLGHNPPAMLRELKNTAERGLYAPHPHFIKDRLQKALAVLLPGRSFFLYENEGVLSAAIHAADLDSGKLLRWRPFLHNAEAAPCSAPLLLPVLPCPFPGAPAVLAVDSEQERELRQKLPPSQMLSPLVLAAAARCVYDLIAAPDRGIIRFHKIERSLKKSSVWKRRGIYLFYNDAEQTANAGNSETIGKNISANYAKLFAHFLAAGFLLPPLPEDPAILPGELSPGEETKIAALLESVQK